VKTSKFPFAIACILALVASCLAQNEETNVTTSVQTKRTPGVLGYMDQKTGTFHPLTNGINPADLPPATTPTTGKLVFNIKIAVNPGLPTTAKIQCEATATVGDLTTNALFTNMGVVNATRSGATATCSITLPYGWFLASPSTDTVVLGIVVDATNGALVTPPYTLATGSQSLTIKVPANGATTTENLSTSI